MLVAQATGKTMLETLAMPAMEFHAWRAHYEKYPPAEWIVPQLLAVVCSLICRVAGSANVEPWDFLPSLKPGSNPNKERAVRAKRTILAGIYGS